jgi:replicative DNA helicase
MTDKLPPVNIEAEEAILGGILLDPGALERVVDLLHPEAFYVSAHRDIYEAALMLHRAGKPTDLMTVIAWLQDRSRLEKVGGTIKLTQLLDRTVSAVNIDRLASLVMDKYLRRSVIEAGHEIVDLGYDTAIELESVFDQSEQKIYLLSNQRLVSNTEQNSAIAIVAYNQLEDNSPIYPTGFYDLDELMVGFEPGTLTLLAGRPSMGKCCHFNTEIVLRDGSICTISELVQRRKDGEIITLGDDWKIRTAKPTDFIDSGVQPVFRVTTRLGRSISTTINHPYLTINGWKPLADLKCGDKIAVPRFLGVFGQETLRPCEVKLLGYLIGDGNISSSNIVRFTNNNLAIGSDFSNAVLDFSPSLKIQMYSYSSSKKAQEYRVVIASNFRAEQRKNLAGRLTSLLSSTWTQKRLADSLKVYPSLVNQWVKGNCLPSQQNFERLCQVLEVQPEQLISQGILTIRSNVKNLLVVWLQELDLCGKTAHTKTVPSIIFRLTKEQIALFLNRLWATDGWATVLSSGQSQLGYATVNEKLARQIQHLLLRFGIIASLKKRSVKYQETRRPAWQLDITDAKSIQIFIEEIGIFGKEEALLAVQKALALKKYQTNSDLIPIEIWERIAAAKGNETWHSLARRAGIAGHSNIHVGKRAPTRERLLALAGALGNLELQRLAKSDVFWDEIISIEPIGSHQVYDLTIPETHNFVANDIFVHNSAISMNFALSMMLQHKLPVAIFSLEMTKKQLEYRLWSALSVMSRYKDLNLIPLRGDRIRKHRAGLEHLTRSEIESIAKILEIAIELPLYLNDSRGITVSGIASECRQIKSKERKLGLVVVDYLQMMAEDSGGNRSYELGDVARSLYKMAGDLEVPVLALSQINRSVESRQNKRPTMADLSQSGILEMVADNVLLAYRDEYYQSNPQNEGILELILAKARHGSTGTATVYFDKSFGRMKNLANGR